MTSSDQLFLSAIQTESIFTNNYFERVSWIVGFRTTKDNVTSNFIKSVQPIYFSIDEIICKENLIQISEELAEFDFERNELNSVIVALKT